MPLTRTRNVMLIGGALYTVVMAFASGAAAPGVAESIQVVR